MDADLRLVFLLCLDEYVRKINNHQSETKGRIYLIYSTMRAGAQSRKLRQG